MSRASRHPNSTSKRAVSQRGMLSVSGDARGARRKEACQGIGRLAHVVHADVVRSQADRGEREAHGARDAIADGARLAAPAENAPDHGLARDADENGTAELAQLR